MKRVISKTYSAKAREGYINFRYQILLTQAGFKLCEKPCFFWVYLQARPRLLLK